MTVPPTHTGMLGNCWLILEPPPANMTKPMENSVISVDQSKILAVTGEAILL